MNLDVELWASFQVKDILSIHNGKGITTEEIEENAGDFAVVQSGEENNGVLGKIDLDYVKSKGYTYTEKPCLTVARSGSAGFVSFQKNGCVVGDSAKILLLPDEVAKTEIYLFLHSILTANRFKYDYGRKVTEDKYMNDYINLPAVVEGRKKKPDFEFMENYIKSLHYKPLTTKNRPENALPLDTHKWEEFQVKDIFTFKNGKGLTTEEIEENAGDFAVVQSGEKNNGVIGLVDLNYCKFKNYVYMLKPCLAVAKNGSAGFVSFQKNGCVAGNDAKILLLPDKIAKVGIYLFLQTILSANRFKYSYGRKVTNEKYENEIIKLPINHKGEPDFEFMENYIKSLPYGDRL